MIYFLFPEAQNTNIKICTNTSKAGKTRGQISQYIILQIKKPLIDWLIEPV